MAGSQDQRLCKLGAAPELSCVNAALQTHLCIFRRCPEMAPGSQDFVSMEGQQGAALQVQEPLWAWLKLAQS